MSRPNLGRLVATVVIRFILLMTLGVLFVGCGTTTPRTPAKEAIQRSDPIGSVGRKLSPIEFLDFLKSQPGVAVLVFNNTRNWIREDDIEPLIHRLDSPAPCAGVATLLSSYLPHHRSTEGHEAGCLIEGFRQNSYPPVGCSELYELDREVLKQWYIHWRSQRDAPK
jgi:hypothetical protein